MATPILLHTKYLVPRHSRERITRPHLTESLHRVTEKRLMLISAPPGYGKTTLLAQFAASTPIPYLWYQLDIADGDPATFLAYLIEGMQHLTHTCWRDDTAPGAAAKAVLEGSQTAVPVSPERALAVLINEIGERAEQDFVVIFEDYHLITNPSVHSLVDYLLENAPSRLHIILSTRSNPPLSLSRLRARGELAELRMADLRLNPDEIQEWLMRHIPNVSAESIQVLTEKTEGWAASLQLLMSSLSGKDADHARQFINELKGTHRYIFEYLADEVFHQQPADVQEFLLATAVLAQMNADACNTLISGKNAQQMLHFLEHHNLFVTSLDENGEWYRYHYLFQEFLLGKLRREQADRLIALEQTAAAYYEGHGEPEVALAHYMRAGDSASAARVLTTFAGDYLERGRAEVLYRYLSALSDDTLRGNPCLLLYSGDALRQLGQVGTCIARYEDARTEFQALGDLSGECRALTALAEVARSQGDYRRAQSLAETALSIAPPSDHAARAHALMALAKSEGFVQGMDRGRTLAEAAVDEARQAGETISAPAHAALLRSLGQICWWHGDPHAAVRYCDEARSLIADELSPIIAQTLITMATPYMYWRDLESARQYAEKGLEIAQQLQLTELLPRAYMTLGSVLTRCGELTRAESCLQQAMELSQRLGAETYEKVMAAGFLAYDLCQQGRFDEAQQQAETVLWSHASHADTYEMYVCRSVLADVALEMGQVDRAESLFQSLVEIGHRRQFHIPLGMVYFGLAYIAIKTGRADQGVEFGRKSLALIEPTNALQLYLDQGERARIVAERLIAAGVQSAFIQTMLEPLAAEPAEPAIQIIDSGVIRLTLLGSFRAYASGIEVGQERWISTKARDLLAYFATFRRERIPVDRVMEALWPEADGQNRTAFHTALYRLRNALRLNEDATKYVLVEGGEYWLDAARFQVDVDEFERLLAQSQRGTSEEMADSLNRAVTLYGGAYLDNLYYDWLLPERQHLEQAYLNALKRLAGQRAQSRHYDEALRLARKALEIDPLLEEMHCAAMQYLAALGDRSGIARQYQTLTDVLRDELDAAPLPASQALYTTLIGSDAKTKSATNM